VLSGDEPTGAKLNSTQRDEIRAVVKEIIDSIKPLDNGAENIPDDAPLFDDGQGEPSPVELDSLDVLDLALAIGERFGLSEEQFDVMTGGEVDLQSLRTVNDIVDFILSASPGPTTGGSDTVSRGAASNGE
jgi:acyl carrier protein